MDSQRGHCRQQEGLRIIVQTKRWLWPNEVLWFGTIGQRSACENYNRWIIPCTWFHHHSYFRSWQELVNEPSQCVNSSNTGQWHARLNHLQWLCDWPGGCTARAHCEVVLELAVLDHGLVNVTTKDLQWVECPDETNCSCRLKQIKADLAIQLGLS